MAFPISVTKVALFPTSVILSQDIGYTQLIMVGPLCSDVINKELNVICVHCFLLSVRDGADTSGMEVEKLLVSFSRRLIPMCPELVEIKNMN
jgi:hypothetical protein